MTGKKFRCNTCPYESNRSDSVKRHIKGVHDKIKKYHCEDCGNDFARKDGLERHWDAVHNTGDKKYKCGICPYSNAQGLNSIEFQQDVQQNFQQIAGHSVRLNTMLKITLNSLLKFN